jgi:hypothetical protein
MLDPAATTPAAADQARLDAAMAASAAERANRPRGLIVAGAVLLVLSVGYLLYTLTQRGAAQASVFSAQRSLDEIQRLAGLIDAESAAMAARGTAPDNAMVSKLEGLVMQAGLNPAGSTISEEPSGPVGQTGMRQRKYKARYTNQDPAAILRWLELTQSSPLTAGLEITRLRLTPAGPGPTAPGLPGAVTNPGPADKAGWNIDVDFARWEKIS